MFSVILLALVMRSEFIFERAPFPSSHASTIVETHGGLVAAWFGGTRERDPDVGIWVSRRDASGWTQPVEVANGVQADGTRHPCWNPVLFQPASGPLVLFYKVGPSPSQWWGMARTSPEDGRTWSAAIRLPPGILGPIRAKPIEIRPGVMLAGSSTEDDGWVAHMERFGGPWEAQGLASAAAWQKSGPLNAKLALAVSGDGKAWRQVTMLEDDSQGEFSYPAMIQSRDGHAHITYTFRREKIKHVTIDPATIEK